MADEKTVTRSDAFGNEFEVPVGADGVNPVTPNNPPLKALPEAERENYTAPDEDDPVEVAQEAAEMQGHVEYDPSDSVDALTPEALPPTSEEEKSEEDSGTDEEAENTATKPSTADPKQAWVDYAVSQGMSAEEADGHTKAELIETYKEA